jgi:hypothetical protein
LSLPDRQVSGVSAWSKARTALTNGAPAAPMATNRRSTLTRVHARALHSLRWPLVVNRDLQRGADPLLHSQAPPAAADPSAAAVPGADNRTPRATTSVAHMTKASYGVTRVRVNSSGVPAPSFIVLPWIVIVSAAPVHPPWPACDKPHWPSVLIGGHGLAKAPVAPLYV